MDEQLRSLCQAFMTGQLPAESLVKRCLQLTSQTTDEAQVDVQRASRCGFPEVIYAEGKSVDTLLQIVQTLHQRAQSVLATRTSAEQREALLSRFPAAHVNVAARTFCLPASGRLPPETGRVAVITAGTSDLPVALEAEETLRWMRVEVVSLRDVGVAGPHRLPAHLDRLRNLDAAVVVAGMEGALPSVVGGYLDCPVFAVPTSVGYGASFQGLAALLGMLNSCAANVAVVNIDAGFKGGYLAGLTAHRRNRPLAQEACETLSPSRPYLHAEAAEAASKDPVP
jgi:NCAIR mutase (PurE)-related protein